MAFTYPLKTKKDINAVTSYLKTVNPTYADFWQFALQTPLRVSDLLRLRFDGLEGDRIRVKEYKTGKIEYMVLNRKAMKIFKARQKANPDHEFLFQSRYKVAPINRKTIHSALSDAGKSIGKKLSAHVTRKTRALLIYNETNDLARVQHMLNHTSSRETLAYLGLTEATKLENYTKFVI